MAETLHAVMVLKTETDKQSSGRSAGRPVGSDREENIERILDAALSCFAAKGYASTTIAEIAVRVGFTRSAIYPYFSNKAEIYNAVLNRQQQAHYDELHEMLISDASFVDKLEAVLSVFMMDHEERRDRSTFLAAIPLEVSRHPELLASYKPKASTPELLIDFFTDAITRGEITDKYTPEDLLVLVLGGVMGMSHFQRSMGVGQVSHAIRAFLDMLHGDFVR